MDAAKPPTAYRRLVRTAIGGAAVLVLALLAYAAAQVLARLAPLSLAVVAALLVAALIGPVNVRLQRWKLPAWLAALTTVTGLLAVLAAASYLIGRRAAGQLDDLQVQVVAGADRLRQTLVDTVPGLDQARVDQIAARIVASLREALPSPYAGITSATEILAAVLLAIFLLFFFLRDGQRMWTWLTGLLPVAHQPDADRAGRSAWRALSAYTHGIVAVAAVDAIGIGAALLILRVPLAASLAVLTFLSAFVPVIGATVAGAAATLVTLVTNGPRDAIIVLAAVIAVQQAEGNLLHPVIMRKAVSLHPVVTLLAVTAGTLTAGIAGALIAVPLCAVVYHAIRGWRTDNTGEPEPAPADPDDSPQHSDQDPQRSSPPDTCRPHEAG